MADDDQPRPIHAPSIPGDPDCVELEEGVAFCRDACCLVTSIQRIELSAREAQLLSLLVAAPNRYHTGEHLASTLSSRQVVGLSVHSIEQLICGIRQKLAMAGCAPNRLRTKYKAGYGLFLGT